MGTMLLAGSAVATRLPTPALNRNEASGKQRFASGHLLHPAFEHATNIGGMTWDCAWRPRKLGKLKSSPAYQKMPAEGRVRRKNTIAKTRIDRKLLCLGSLAPLYGGKKNGFFRVGGSPRLRTMG